MIGSGLQVRLITSSRRLLSGNAAPTSSISSAKKSGGGRIMFLGLTGALVVVGGGVALTYEQPEYGNWVKQQVPALTPTLVSLHQLYASAKEAVARQLDNSPSTSMFEFRAIVHVDLLCRTCRIDACPNVQGHHS
jgi:hypothetical protein